MLGECMIAWVDRRLRQATGHQHKPFGGLSIILVGDLGQLSAVGDCPLYAPEGMVPMDTHYTNYLLQLYSLNKRCNKQATIPTQLHLGNS